VRISQGVSHGLLMSEVAPKYPPLARSARVQGQVVLNVVIGKDGAVKNITAKSGHPLLVPAAIEAVKQWRYQPYKLSGKPVEVNTEVVVLFTLTN
jgi:protein TonB